MYRSLFLILRLVSYIGDVVNRTREPAAPDTTFTSPTSVCCVVLCPSSDDESSKLTNNKHISVPQLPAPNVHTRTALWQNDMSSLINHEDFAAFYVAKGVKPLSLELTWRQASFPSCQRID